MSDPDRKDLQAFLKGEPQGAKALIARYATPLINQASYMLGGDRAMAEDVVQNTFLKLWRKADALLSSDRELHLRAWLFRVTRNSCLDEMRRHGHETMNEDFDAADGSLPADARLEHQDRAAMVMALVARLPERQKSALLMAHFEGMGNAEIAQVMDCSVEAVENLLARARRSLRQWAQNENMDEEAL